MPETPPQPEVSRTATTKSRKSVRKTISFAADEDAEGPKIPTNSDPAVVKILGFLAIFLKAQGLRTADFFRNPKYNPSYFIKGQRNEFLNAEQLWGVMEKLQTDTDLCAGLQITKKDCKDFLKSIDVDGDSTFGIDELDSALRKQRRGIFIDTQSAEESKTPKSRKSMAYLRRSSAAVHLSGAEEVPCGSKAMNGIQAILDSKRLRIQDIFRHPGWNPAYAEKGAENMSPTDIQGVLAKAGLCLSIKDVAAMVRVIDKDGNGGVDLQELEQCLRLHRRGKMDWSGANEKETAKKRDVDMERLHKLYNRAKEMAEAKEKRREERDAAEDAELARGREANRIGSRKMIDAKSLDKNATERFYKEHLKKDARRKQLILDSHAEEERQLDATRCRPKRSASVPDRQREAEYNEKFGTNHKHIGERLHAERELKDEQMKRIRIAIETHMLKQVDCIGAAALARGHDATRHHKLYEDSKYKEERKDMARWQKMQEEQRHMSERLVGRHREPLTDVSRQEMHEEQKRRNSKIRKLVAEAEVAKSKALSQTLWVRPAVPQKYANVESKLHHKRPHSAGPRAPSEVQRKQHPKGFGSSACRTTHPRDAESEKWRIEAVDHTLQVLNQVCSHRGMCAMQENDMAKLQDLADLLTEVFDEYKEALEETKSNGEGHIYLGRMDSMRLFNGGYLMEDRVGWHHCCEPDKIRQINGDLDELYVQATYAQNMLLCYTGPAPNKATHEKIAGLWKVGTKWNHPAATKKAMFAYNPGLKSRERAEAKAWVRYSPAEGSGRFKHLTDLARVGLVFENAMALRQGLEQVIASFEVINVRNCYQHRHSNLLGNCLVEVLVVVKIPDPFVCEIRLEEICYFMARENTQPNIDAICNRMADMYSHNGASKPFLKYLAEWTLHKPKECHALRVFQRHLSMRYGSMVVAWRKVMGNHKTVSFQTFREVVQDVDQRDHTVEFWQDLDSNQAGTVSLFELDPDATMLLVRFHMRISTFMTEDEMEDPHKVFVRLTAKMKLIRPGVLEAHEFRRITKMLGFTASESNKLFAYLDEKGGAGSEPPATLVVQDLAWLILKLPNLVCKEGIMLLDEAMGVGKSLMSATRSDREDKRQETLPRPSVALYARKPSVSQQADPLSPTTRKSIRAESLEMFNASLPAANTEAPEADSDAEAADEEAVEESTPDGQSNGTSPTRAPSSTQGSPASPMAKTVLKSAYGAATRPSAKYRSSLGFAAPPRMSLQAFPQGVIEQLAPELAERGKQPAPEEDEAADGDLGAPAPDEDSRDGQPKQRQSVSFGQRETHELGEDEADHENLDEEGSPVKVSKISNMFGGSVKKKGKVNQANAQAEARVESISLTTTTHSTSQIKTSNTKTVEATKEVWNGGELVDSSFHVSTTAANTADAPFEKFEGAEAAKNENFEDDDVAATYSF